MRTVAVGPGEAGDGRNIPRLRIAVHRRGSTTVYVPWYARFDFSCERICSPLPRAFMPPTETRLSMAALHVTTEPVRRRCDRLGWPSIGREHRLLEAAFVPFVTAPVRPPG